MLDPIWDGITDPTDEADTNQEPSRREEFLRVSAGGKERRKADTTDFDEGSSVKGPQLLFIKAWLQK